MTCYFCSPSADIIATKNSLCYARWDRNPVSRGHMLVIPFRHVQDFLPCPARKNMRYSNLWATVSG
ncbi:MAG TPA: HIT domain-containing protein [Methanoregula sp.]|nr:HIT domain-containing protein [Methanoregula sp.]